MSELKPPNLAGIRDIALSYGTGYMDAEQQAEVINALFELCECVEHLHAYTAELQRRSIEAINEVRSTA